MIVNASLPPTQALRIVPRVVPFRVLMPLPPIARHLCPRQSGLLIYCVELAVGTTFPLTPARIGGGGVAKVQVIRGVRGWEITLARFRVDRPRSGSNQTGDAD